MTQYNTNTVENLESILLNKDYHRIIFMKIEKDTTFHLSSGNSIHIFTNDEKYIIFINLIEEGMGLRGHNTYNKIMIENIKKDDIYVDVYTTQDYIVKRILLIIEDILGCSVY